MGLFDKLFNKTSYFEICENENNDVYYNKNKRSKKLEDLRKEREYYKNELEIEKNKPKKSLIRVWDLETKLDDIEELIMKELKK